MTLIRIAMKMNIYKNNNLALLTDLYELTMMQGYFFYQKNLEMVFDMFFRRQPFGGGYAVFAGLEPLIKTILNLRFKDDDLNYLDKLKLFKPEFLKFLSDFKFRGNIYSVEEGEVVFPNEPLIRVQGKAIETQLIESVLLNTINFQTLIATKSARVVEAAKGRAVMEFGLRRAHGVDGALSATRAALIGGAASSSNVLGGKIFDLPVSGTMAHSWVMSFSSELESFEKYARIYPENTVLLVDTYDTLKKGIPSAIKVLKKLKKQGIKKFGLRLDSGDLEYLSKQARLMLDRAGLREAKIVASNELDEQIIEQLIKSESPIDFFGVGTKLVTANGDSALSGIYKLVAAGQKGKYRPKIKISNSLEKTTNPDVKNVLRIYDKDNFMLGDIIFLEAERKDIEQKAAKMGWEYENMAIADYRQTKILLKNIVMEGRLNYNFPDLKDIRKKTKDNLNALSSRYKRLLNPHIYKVGMTRKLMNLKLNLIKKYG